MDLNGSAADNRKRWWIYAFVPLAVILIAVAVLIVLDLAKPESGGIDETAVSGERVTEVPELLNIGESLSAIEIKDNGFGGEAANAAGAGGEAEVVPENALITPFEGGLLYPITPNESIACGKWPAGSLDLPYFGAPRENGRKHAGVDLYPVGGESTPIRTMKNGTVLKVELFFVRSTGEKTYAVLVDHGDMVVNYAELQPPVVSAGRQVSAGELLGNLSGTEQLHFEVYSPGTTNWCPWYGDKPANLQDPTAMMLELYNR